MIVHCPHCSTRHVMPEPASPAVRSRSRARPAATAGPRWRRSTWWKSLPATCRASSTTRSSPSLRPAVLPRSPARLNAISARPAPGASAACATGRPMASSSRAHHRRPALPEQVVEAAPVTIRPTEARLQREHLRPRTPPHRAPACHCQRHPRALDQGRHRQRQRRGTQAAVAPLFALEDDSGKELYSWTPTPPPAPCGPARRQASPPVCRPRPRHPHTSKSVCKGR